MTKMRSGNNSSDLLDTLKCPITYELFRDPVIGGDGHTYERENITAWIQKHATSPITREPMDLNSLRPNFIVKKMVEDFVSLSLQKQYQFRLDIDVCKAKQRPIFQSSGKTIYEAKWMLKHGPPIILIQIDGAKAKREASFYVKLSCHPHIVRTYGLVDNHSSDSIMLVQEYAPEGDLSELLRSKYFQPTLEVLIEIFRQIVDAMICLADNQIIHGDLACRNVLVFRSNSNQSSEILVKLTDFGLTRTSSLFSVIDSPASCTMKIIPIRYAAPELLVDVSSMNYSEKSDVYSFGVLMWEACSEGAVPYGDLKTTDNVYEEKLKGKLLERPNVCTNELWNMILHCTQKESHDRPNFKTIREALFALQYQTKRESTTKTSLTRVDCNYQNMTDRRSKSEQRTHSQYYNQTSISKDSHYDKPTNSPLYRNLNNSSSGEYMFPDSTNSKQSLCEYYIPCEYCLQSINTENFNTHADVCSVRRVVKSFVKVAVQFQPLEITSCPYCELMIPLNMLNIHQNTCDRIKVCLYNVFQISSQQQPSIDSYVTFTYLKPMSLLNHPIGKNVYEYASIPEGQTEYPSSTLAKQSDISNPTCVEHVSMDLKTPKPSKPPKSGLRKAFSKFKKKISS